MIIEEIIITHVLEMAKERQKEINHLDIGNYVGEHYLKIMMIVQHMNQTIFNKKEVFRVIDNVAKEQGVFEGWTHKAIKEAVEKLCK